MLGRMVSEALGVELGMEDEATEGAQLGRIVG